MIDDKRRRRADLALRLRIGCLVLVAMFFVIVAVVAPIPLWGRLVIAAAAALELAFAASARKVRRTLGARRDDRM